MSTSNAMQRPKYLLVPGWIKSRRDGQSYFLCASELAHRYQLKPGEFRVYREWAGIDPTLYTVLTPRHDGNYTLPG